jgi:hypothetical protein
MLAQNITSGSTVSGRNRRAAASMEPTRNLLEPAPHEAEPITSFQSCQESYILLSVFESRIPLME